MIHPYKLLGIDMRIKTYYVGYVVSGGEVRAYVSYVLESVDKDVEVHLHSINGEVRLEVIMEPEITKDKKKLVRHVVKSLISSIEASLTVLEEVLREVPEGEKTKVLRKLGEVLNKLV
jgi:hypothetical protein